MTALAALHLRGEEGEQPYKRHVVASQSRIVLEDLFCQVPPYDRHLDGQPDVQDSQHNGFGKPDNPRHTILEEGLFFLLDPLLERWALSSDEGSAQALERFEGL